MKVSTGTAWIAHADPRPARFSKRHSVGALARANQGHAQIGRVVQILIARRDPEHPLANHVHHGMTQLAPLARIDQPTSHRRRQTRTAVRLAQQQRTAVARHKPAVETRRDTAGPDS